MHWAQEFLSARRPLSLEYAANPRTLDSGPASDLRAPCTLAVTTLLAGLL
jgi:hypothetical protein